MKENEKVERNYGLDLLRIISAISVVLMHVNAEFYFGEYGGADKNQLIKFIECFVNLITRFSVPVFIMISGAFNLSNSQNREQRFFYTKSFSRIGIFVIGKMAGSNSITKGLLQKDTYKNQGYILSKNTMNAIRENEKNYDYYDGIVLFRNDEALVQRIINNRPFG